MIQVLIIVLLALFLVSGISFIGVVFLGVQKNLEKILFVLVSFATGALLGGAFIHIVPETFELLDPSEFSMYLLLGFILFFFAEQFLHWHHCHGPSCEVLSVSYLVLVGDGIHNFVDGLIIAVAFLTNFELGIATTIAVIFHEIPQEIGDFSILVYSGFSVKKALVFNFLSALTAVLGGLIGVYIGAILSNSVGYLLAIAGGGFIYVAGSDLIPELHKTHGFKSILIQAAFMLTGIGIMWII